MQLHLRLDDDPALVRIRDRLRQAFGAPRIFLRRDPVSQLVRSMIGSRTYDAVSEAVFAQLRARFRPWSRLADARFDEVAPLVAPVTYAEDKGRRLIAALALVRRQAGAVGLDFLEPWPLEDAMAWLQALPGVGQKVAASVLNFSTLRRRVFVVDGHVLRVATRVGLIAPQDDADACRDTVMDAAPDAWTAEDFTELHTLVKQLGQSFCRPASPDCPSCPLEELCRHPAGPRREDPPARPRDHTHAPVAANQNHTDLAHDALTAYLRRRLMRLERMGVSPGLLLAAGVGLRREIDEAFVGRRLPPGAHQSSGATMEDGASALAPALAAVAALPSRSGLRVLVVQEGDARREHGEMHGPGLEAWGLNPREAAFVRARDGPQALEVADEALRGRAAPAVLLELRRGAHLADLSVTRRFNLQARRAGLFLFLVTPSLEGASAATTRWRVGAHASRAPRRRVGPPTFRLDLVRNRAGRTGSWIAEWSAHERRFLSARAVAPERFGEEGPDVGFLRGDGRRGPARRFLHLWLPQLSTDRVRRERPEIADAAPLATVGKGRNALRLLAVDAGAAQAGLVCGLTVRDARRRLPDLVTAPHDPEADAALMRRLSSACRRFTPALAEAVDGLTLDVTGSTPLFAGEAALLAAVEALFGAQRVAVRPGLADTPTAAWTLARFAADPVSPPGALREALEPLPVEALRRPGDEAEGLVEDLRGLGLRTLGAALGRPRESLSQALDAQLWLRLDELLGARACPLTLRLEPVRFVSERRLMQPVSGADAILHHVRRLAEPVRDQLQRRRAGGRGFILTLFGDRGRFREVRVAARRALTDPVEIAALFARRLEAAGVAESAPGRALGDGPEEEAFDHLRLEARPVERLGERTGDLLGEQRGEAFEAFAANLQARFGLDVVQGIVADPRSAKPEREVRFAPFGAKSPAQGPQPPASAWGDAVLRPLRLFSRPEPIAVLSEPSDRPPFTFAWRRVRHTVVRAEGPERLSPEWGREAPGTRTRDYFRVEDETGRRFWIYREGFFVEDAHGEAGAPRWFLHGLFA